MSSKNVMPSPSPSTAHLSDPKHRNTSKSTTHDVEELFEKEKVTTPLAAVAGAEHGQPDNSELEEEELENDTQLRAIASQDRERDIEKGLPSTAGPDSGRTSPTAAAIPPSTPPVDPNIITWDGPDDPANPKNWPFKKKWAVTATVSFFTLMRYVLLKLILVGVVESFRSAALVRLQITHLMLSLCA